MAEDTLELTSRIAALAGDMELVSKIDPSLGLVSKLDMEIEMVSRVSTVANLSSQVSLEVI